jgi:hypothetical protein
MGKQQERIDISCDEGHLASFSDQEDIYTG